MLSKSLQIALEENNTIRKKEFYLESRLGAKALLPGESEEEVVAGCTHWLNLIYGNLNVCKMEYNVSPK